MTCPYLNFHCTHEDKQGNNFVLELINLADLDDKSSLVDTLNIDYGRFNQCVVGLTIPLIYWIC